MAKSEIKYVTDVSEYNMFKAQFIQVIEELEECQNYSMRHFIVLCLKQNTKQYVSESIEQVLEVFLRKFPEVGYSADLIYLTLFLLFFSSVPSTYSLLTIIYSNVLPPHLYNRQLRLKPYDFQHEVQNVTAINEKVNKQVSKLFLENRLYRYIVTFTLNMFLFETTFAIINQTLLDNQNPYQTFLKALSVCVNLPRQDIERLRNNYQELEVLLLRNVRLTQIQTLMIQTRQFSMTKMETKQQSIFTRSSTIKEEKEVKAKVKEELQKSELIGLESQVSSQKMSIEALMNQILLMKQTIQEQQTAYERMEQDSEAQKKQVQRLQEQSASDKLALIEANEKTKQANTSDINLLEYNNLKAENQNLLNQLNQTRKLLQESINREEEKGQTCAVLQDQLVRVQMDSRKAQSLMDQQLYELSAQEKKMMFMEYDREIQQIGNEEEEQDKMYLILASKNEEIMELKERIGELQSRIKQGDKNKKDLGLLTSQLEGTLNQKNLYIQKLQEQLLTKQETPKQNGVQAEDSKQMQLDLNDLRQIVVRQSEDLKILQQKEITNQEQINKLNQTNQELTQTNQEIKTELLKYDQIDQKFGKVEIMKDPMIQQDINELQNGLNPEKNRILQTLIQLIQSLQKDLKYKQLEVQMKKEELKGIDQDEQTVQLKQKIKQQEDQLRSQEEEIKEMRQEDNRNIQMLRKRKSQNASDVQGSISSTMGMQKSQTEEKEVLKENKTGCGSNNQACAFF